MLKILRREDGQMSVELAVVLPVILAVMLILVDGLVYVGECARFDQAAPQAVLACAVTDGGDGYDEQARAAQVRAALETEFDGRSQQVEISTSSGWGVATYVCTLHMAPWPLAPGGIHVFGVSIPMALEHSCSFSVDPYVVGGLL